MKKNTKVSRKNTDSKTIMTLLDQGAKAHTTARMRYTTLLASLRGNGVAFKDIEAYLLKLHNGTYWNKQEDIDKARKLDLVWIHNIDLFTKWVKRNYHSYSKPKNKKPRVNTKGKRVVRREIKVTPERTKEMLKNPNNTEVIVKEAVKDSVAFNMFLELILEDVNLTDELISILDDAGYNVWFEPKEAVGY